MVSLGWLLTMIISTPHSVDDRMINACEAAGGMRVGRGNRSICPPQIPHDLTRDRTRAAVAEGEPNGR
jgi:hypothetical protein